MKKLDMDLELLVQSFSFNSDDLGKEYLDTDTGDIINIPSEVMKVAEENGDESDLEDWQEELLKDAYAIKENSKERYIVIPTIEDSYYCDSMMSFAKEKISSEELKNQLLDALDSNEPVRAFKNIIFKNEGEIDNWHDYEEEKLKEYAIRWLTSIGIELK